MTRAQSIKEKISHETAKFFGVLPQHVQDDEDTRVEVKMTDEEEKWQKRRFRHLKHYGVKPDRVERRLTERIGKIRRKKNHFLGIDALTELATPDVADRMSDRSSEQVQSTKIFPDVLDIQAL